jgi:hypothetical protein
MKIYAFILMLLLPSCIISALDLGMGWGASICFPIENPLARSSIAYCAYFDATYIQLSAGYRFQYRTTTPIFDLKWFDFVATIKYPFLFDPIRIYPFVGIDYEPNLSYTDNNGNDIKSTLNISEQAQLSTIWLNVGVGFDLVVYLEKRTKAKWYYRIETVFCFNPVVNGYRIAGNIFYGCIFP